MAILGDVEVTIVVNGKPVPEHQSSYISSDPGQQSQPDTIHSYISATNTPFAIDYKVRCGPHWLSPSPSSSSSYSTPFDYIVFRTKFDALKYGTAHVPKSRYTKPGSYRVRKRGKRYHENGGWHFRGYHFFTADLSGGRPPLSCAVGDIYVPNVIRVEVWGENEYARADDAGVNGRPVSRGEDWGVEDVLNPLQSWGKNTVEPPRVRYTGALEERPLAIFVFENCSPESLQAMGIGMENQLAMTFDAMETDPDELMLIGVKDKLTQQSPDDYQMSGAIPCESPLGLDRPHMFGLVGEYDEGLTLAPILSNSSNTTDAVEEIDFIEVKDKPTPRAPSQSKSSAPISSLFKQSKSQILGLAGKGANGEVIDLLQDMSNGDTAEGAVEVIDVVEVKDDSTQQGPYQPGRFVPCGGTLDFEDSEMLGMEMPGKDGDIFHLAHDVSNGNDSRRAVEVIDLTDL